jgi:hypothetical protein
MCLCRTRNGNHALRCHPRQCNLRCCAPLALSKFLELFDDGAVLVEVVALELWDCGTSVLAYH